MCERHTLRYSYYLFVLTTWARAGIRYVYSYYLYFSSSLEHGADIRCVYRYSLYFSSSLEHGQVLHYRNWSNVAHCAILRQGVSHAWREDIEAHCGIKARFFGVEANMVRAKTEWKHDMRLYPGGVPLNNQTWQIGFAYCCSNARLRTQQYR